MCKNRGIVGCLGPSRVLITMAAMAVAPVILLTLTLTLTLLILLSYYGLTKTTLTLP